LILIGIPTNKQADKPANKPFNKPAIEWKYDGIGQWTNETINQQVDAPKERKIDLIKNTP
jgi:hypothetical protein